MSETKAGGGAREPTKEMRDFSSWPKEELDGAPRTRECLADGKKTIGQVRADLERLCVTLERELAHAAPDKGARDGGLSQAAVDVLAERRAQITREGWTTGHDDSHIYREMARAAACYLEHYNGRERVYEGGNRDAYKTEPAPRDWPWDNKWWKPKDPRRDLVRAIALLLAEVERRDRATAPLAKRRETMSERKSGEVRNLYVDEITRLTAELQSTKAALEKVEAERDEAVASRSAVLQAFHIAESRAEKAEAELRNITNAERFNRERFRDDTEFADWAQSRARHMLARAITQKERP